MTREQREAHLVRHYIRAFRLVAVYSGVASRSGRTLIGFCRNLEARTKALKAKHGCVTIYSVWWVSDETKARALIGALPCATASARADFPGAAARLRVSLTSDSDVRERATAGIARLRQAGAKQLRAVNAQYRETRLRRAAAGFKTVSYATFLHRHEIRELYRSAEHFFGDQGGRC